MADGVVAGADYKVSPDTLLGFALAFGLPAGWAAGWAERSRPACSSAFRGARAAAEFWAGLYLGGAGLWLARRHHQPHGGAGFYIDQLQARFRPDSFSGRFEAGYRYRFATPVIGITPYAAAQVISFDLPSYAEQAMVGSGSVRAELRIADHDRYPH